MYNKLNKIAVYFKKSKNQTNKNKNRVPLDEHMQHLKPIPMSQHGQEEQDSTLLTTSAQTCTVHSNVSFAGSK